MSSQSQESDPGLKSMVEPFLTVDQIIVRLVSTLSAMFLVYGIYLVLFGICVRDLVLYKERPNRRLYLWWTISLFVLATISGASIATLTIKQTIVGFTALQTQDFIPLLDYLYKDMVKATTNGIINHVTIIINVAADSMLIHRCHVIWGSRKRIGVPLIIFSVLINLLGLAGAIMDTLLVSDLSVPAFIKLNVTMTKIENAYLISNAAFNMILTLMSASRIWWISREARAQMGQAVNLKYKTIVAIILESGLLYPLFIIVYVVMTTAVDPDAVGLVPFDIFPLVQQMAGIAPTLIIVRANRGKSINNVEHLISTMRFANSVPAPESETTSHIGSPKSRSDEKI